MTDTNRAEPMKGLAEFLRQYATTDAAFVSSMVPLDQLTRWAAEVEASRLPQAGAATSDEQIEFALNNQMEDPSEDEARGFHAGARWAMSLAALTVPRDLDVAGVPKLPLSALESLAVDACNLVKAWAESDRKTPFPEDAHMLADGVLMLAAQRRKGVQ